MKPSISRNFKHSINNSHENAMQKVRDDTIKHSSTE